MHSTHPLPKGKTLHDTQPGKANAGGNGYKQVTEDGWVAYKELG